MLGLRTVLSRKCGTRNALVCVRRLLDANLLVRALAAAAARAEEPEETGCQAEGDGEPEDRQHLAAERGFNVVRLEHGFEDAGEHGVDGCGGDGGGEDEDCLGLGENESTPDAVKGEWERGKRTHSRHNRRNHTSPPAEDSEEADDEFRHAKHQRNDERPDHPSGHLLVCVQALLQVLTNRLLQARVLELPHGERVEPEARRALGAKVNRLFTGACIFRAGAVRPQADLVECLELAGLGAALECVEQVVIDVD